jgi:hypothetical protein
MKRRRLLVGMGFMLGLGALVLYGRPRLPEGFATPAACLDAYRDASKQGALDRYLSCLGEPLRSEKQRSATVEGLIRGMDGVKSWTRHEAVIREGMADVDVDLVRKAGTYRLSFRLQRMERGWVIVVINGPHERTSPVQYGTPVSETAE